jgi:hypothetical protein
MRKIFLGLVFLVMTGLPSKAQEETFYCYYQGSSIVKPLIHSLNINKTESSNKTNRCKGLQSDLLKEGEGSVEISGKLYEQLKDIDTRYRDKWYSIYISGDRDKFIKFENEWRDALVSHYNKYSGITTATKPSEERNKIADFSKKEIQPKLTEEQIKISKMKPEDRHAYTCTQKFGFRKNSDKFKDCVFEMYKAETELEKLELQKKIIEANLELAKTRESAARSGQDRNTALLERQALAQERTAAASAQQARIADFESSQRMIDDGLALMRGDRNLAGQVRAPRMRTTCTNLGGFITCN